jgi:deoxyribodipyrimidine photolyase-related protein
MKRAFLVLPHQLFEDTVLLKQAGVIFLVEEYLFFNQYRFHKQKLALHRASMKYYESYLKKNGLNTVYIEASDPRSDVRVLLREIEAEHIVHYDVCDCWLDKRIVSACSERKLGRTEYPTPLFINTRQDLETYFGGKEKYFQTDFYTAQRKKLRILVDAQNKPEGGKWSFDAENRLRYPKDKKPPQTRFPEPDAFSREAVAYVEQHYPDNYGKRSDGLQYPWTHRLSEAWLQQFLETRFAAFGDYEDALVDNENFLHHSVLTPMLNVGLLQPMQVVNAALNFAASHRVSLNSLEGFIRQIIGWREFIRGVYVYRGTRERTTNFWGFTRPLPDAFYRATTGLAPVDKTIEKLLATGYNHHIERLMVLGNIMLLSEYDPDEVYRWFMEMYIDAYDWVMVPNVYGMSQFADGGLMATKPYISGSNYLLKMSNYKKGDWCVTWDALFWNFMDKQRAFFSSNPRLGMLLKTFDNMAEEKKKNIRLAAAAWNGRV